MATSISPSPFTSDPLLPPPERSGDGWHLLSTLATRWRTLVIWPVAAAVVGALLSFTVRPSYTSVTSFVAESRDRMPAAMAGFAGAAAQLGLGVPSSPSTSPQFYADVLRSREVLETVLQSRVSDTRTAAPNDSVAALEFFGRPRNTLAVRLGEAVPRLRRSSSVSLNPRTGIIELRVSAPHPVTAMEVARRFVAVLNDFNLERRQSQAGQRRRFVGNRLREAQDSLRRAEFALQEFLQSNRRYREAPSLIFQFERLQRHVTIYQDLASSLRREYETARIDEVNDTPVITMIDSAKVPLTTSAPNRVLAAGVAGMLGAFFALVLLLAQAYVSKLRDERPEDYVRLRNIAGSFLGTLGFRRGRRARVA